MGFDPLKGLSGGVMGTLLIHLASSVPLGSPWVTLEGAMVGVPPIRVQWFVCYFLNSTFSKTRRNDLELSRSLIELQNPWQPDKWDPPLPVCSDGIRVRGILADPRGGGRKSFDVETFSETTCMFTLSETET